MAPRGNKSSNQQKANPQVKKTTRSRDRSQTLPFMEDAPMLSEQLSTIAETAADAAHRKSKIQQNKIVGRRLDKNQVVEFKHEAKPLLSGCKA
eukprot:IDg7501t1